MGSNNISNLGASGGLGEISFGVNEVGLTIGGVTTIPSTSTVYTVGTLIQGVEITGTATIPSTAAVNAGGRADVGLYVITVPPNSLIAVMDLGAIQLGQVLDSPIFIDGLFSTVPQSTAQVFTGGVVGSGLNIVGGATIPSTAAVLNSFDGTVELQSGVVILGGFTIPSTAQVFTPGGVAGLPIVGTVTIPSTAQVFTGGSVFGGNAVEQMTPEWAGRGLATITRRPFNEWDYLLEEEKHRAAQALAALVEEGDKANQRGLAGLGMLDASASYIPSQLTLSRRNFFERGKLLTPADAGAADHVVLQFSVPTGYFGVLLGYYCQYMGTGFVQGSGDIAFRLKSGNAWVRSMGNLLYTVGSLSNTFSVPLLTLLTPDDVLTFSVNVPNTSGFIQVGTSYILCGLQGWLYPMAAYNQIRKC